MPTQRIPLFGSYQNRNQNPTLFTATAPDQQFINCYPDVTKNALSGKGSVTLNKRPGWASQGDLSTLVGNFGGCIWYGNSAVLSPVCASFSTGGAIRIYNLNTGTQIGGDIGSTDVCHSLTEASISGVANLIAVVRSTAGAKPLQAWFFPEGGAWTQITDADFPLNLGTPEPLTGAPVQLAGFTFFMTKNAKIWNSDVNSLSAWTASSYSTAQSYPDRGVGLARYKDNIVAFGTGSIQFFQNAGLSPSPIQPIGNADRRIGAFAGYDDGNLLTYRSVFEYGDTVYFIGVDTETARKGVYRLNGFAPEKISNSAVDRVLNLGATYHRIVGSFQSHGLSHIVIGQISGPFYCYCVDNGWWWLMETASLGGSSGPRVILGGGLTGGSINSFMTTINDGVYYGLAPSSPTYLDNALTMTQTIITEKVDHGTTERKFIKRVRPVCDKQSGSSTLSLSYSDDDYGTYSTAVGIDISSQAAIDFGWSRLGSYRGGRAYKLTHASNTANRMMAIDIEYEIAA